MTVVLNYITILHYTVVSHKTGSRLTKNHSVAAKCSTGYLVYNNVTWYRKICAQLVTHFLIWKTWGQKGLCRFVTKQKTIALVSLKKQNWRETRPYFINTVVNKHLFLQIKTLVHDFSTLIRLFWTAMPPAGTWIFLSAISLCEVFSTIVLKWKEVSDFFYIAFQGLISHYNQYLDNCEGKCTCSSTFPTVQP